MNPLRKKIEKAVEEKLENIRTVRVLEVHALGPKDVENLLEFMHQGKVVEDLIKENIELRGRYLRLEAKLAFMSDKIASEKWRRVLELSHEIIKEEEDED